MMMNNNRMLHEEELMNLLTEAASRGITTREELFQDAELKSELAGAFWMWFVNVGMRTKYCMSRIRQNELEVEDVATDCYMKLFSNENHTLDKILSIAAESNARSAVKYCMSINGSILIDVLRKKTSHEKRCNGGDFSCIVVSSDASECPENIALFQNTATDMLAAFNGSFLPAVGMMGNALGYSCDEVAEELLRGNACAFVGDMVAMLADVTGVDAFALLQGVLEQAAVYTVAPEHLQDRSKLRAALYRGTSSARNRVKAQCSKRSA